VIDPIVTHALLLDAPAREGRAPRRGQHAQLSGAVGSGGAGHVAAGDARRSLSARHLGTPIRVCPAIRAAATPVDFDEEGEARRMSRYAHTVPVEILRARDEAFCGTIATMLADAVGQHAAGLPWLCKVFASSPCVTAAKEVRGPLPVDSLVSRVFREGLPNIGRMLDVAQLARLRRLLADRDVTVQDAAHVLRFSSSSSAHRFVRRMAGESVAIWRLTSTPGAGMLSRYIAAEIAFHRATWSWFDPWMSPQAYTLARLEFGRTRRVAA
jgi:AraC-like DNA-binding protein